MAIVSLKNKTKSGELLVGNTPPGRGFQLLASTTVGSGGAATITFSSIPSDYTHLQIRGIYDSVFQADNTLRFNSDSGSNYSWHSVYGQGSSVTAINSVNSTNCYFGYTANVASVNGCVIDILDYKNTNKYKTIRALAGYDANGSGFIFFSSGSWRNTNAITTITLHSDTNFTQYSHFALYGILGV